MHNTAQTLLDNASPHEIEWGELEPIKGQLLPVEPFNPKLLPDQFRSWVMDIADRMQCPPDYPAVGAMTTLGAVVGCNINMRPKRFDDWSIPGNLWGLVVGRPSAMKTPSLREPLLPLELLEALERNRHKEVLAEYEASTLVTAATNKANKTTLEKTKDKQEALALARDMIASESQEAPVLKRYLTNDTSVARLGELEMSNDGGLMVYRDELMGLLKTWVQEGNNDSEFFMEGWNGNGGYSFDRIMRGRTYIPHHCLTLLGSIQPGPLASLTRDALKGGAMDNGCIQRFQLAVYPDLGTKWQNIDRKPDLAARESAFKVYERLAAMCPDAIGAERDDEHSTPYLRFDDTTADEFAEWLAVHETRLRSGDESAAMEGHLGKYRSLVPKLALLIHLADVGCGPVGSVALGRACAWAEYLESHARRIYGMAVNADMETARLILTKIKQGQIKSEFSARAVYNSDWSGLNDADNVRRGLGVLDDYGYTRKIIRTTGGRPSETYLVNPKLYGG